MSSPDAHGYHEPNIIITPSDKGDPTTLATSTRNGDLILDLTYLSPIEQMPTQQPASRRRRRCQGHSNRYSLGQHAYDSMSYIITTTGYTVSRIIPYLIDPKLAPFGIFGLILGIVYMFCFVMKKYRKQWWLRRIYPEGQEEDPSVWICMAEVTAFASSLRLELFLQDPHYKFEELPILNSGKIRHESATTYAPTIPTPVVSTITRGQDRQLSTVPL